MKILVTICARGGSKGIPKKNIKPLNNTPLINYSINNAKQIKDKWGAEIIISSDCEEILKKGELMGIETEYKRPDFLSGDEAGKIDTIKHALLYKEKKHSITFDYLIDLDVSSPLRNIFDIEKGFNILLEDIEMISLFSVNLANRNPYFNMVEKKGKNSLKLVIKPKKFIVRTQDAPAVYELNASIYFWKRKACFKQIGPFCKKTFFYEMPYERSIDIDNLSDFKMVEFFSKNND